MKVAVLGGTGDFGLALAKRLAAVGDEVVIGSRDAARAEAAGAEVGAAGAANEDAVRGVDIVVLAVKSDAALPTAASLAAAIGDTPTLSVASELNFSKTGVRPREGGRSLAEDTQALLRGPVVAGLHSLAAASLEKGPAAGDALICGDDPAAKELALELAGKVVSGRSLDAGPIESARALEGMVAVIVNLNKRYKGHAGVSITGLP
jgi:NADPH-dependent F420 reductase